MTLIQNLNVALENPRFLIPILIWSLIWKGVALWKCGRNNQLKWFVVLLIVNTVGILEIIYISWFQRDYNKKRK